MATNGVGTHGGEEGGNNRVHIDNVEEEKKCNKFEGINNVVWMIVGGLLTMTTARLFHSFHLSTDNEREGRGNVAIGGGGVWRQQTCQMVELDSHQCSMAGSEVKMCVCSVCHLCRAAFLLILFFLQ